MPSTDVPTLEFDNLPPVTKRTRGKQETPPLTTAQRLGSLVKSARDIMRKDKGLSGDTDRLPQLTWIMFLKFLDDLERGREDEALLSDQPFRPILTAPYRWRDWANKDAGLTGDDLLEFVSAQELTLGKDDNGNDKKSPGLFHYLREFQGNENPQRAIVGNIFRNTQNRMADGYLLKNVTNLVDSIHFDSHEEIHTLGRMYETMLKEMRDAAGDAGEFYTPRPVVRFMVEALNPRLGETVYDPAAGTGGFLCEAFQYLEKQCRTVEDRSTLQTRSILGGEAKALPYLLCQMNLLLHGVESPTITLDNSLKVRLGEIGEKDRVSIILTNPPFGGEEEPIVQNGFPPDKRTSETTLLFLQLIMRKLHREGTPGRAGVVVPNGTLFADGVAARVKEELLKEFNLHTVVRLPAGVFAPYTGIPTNILFFDRSEPATNIWYYEVPKRDGGNYSKSKPIQYEEFVDCLTWWNAREENDRAWLVPVAEILANKANLDRRNPSIVEGLEHIAPNVLIEQIISKEKEILSLLAEVQRTLGSVHNE